MPAHELVGESAELVRGSQCGLIDLVAPAAGEVARRAVGDLRPRGFCKYDVAASGGA